MSSPPTEVKQEIKVEESKPDQMTNGSHHMNGDTEPLRQSTGSLSPAPIKSEKAEPIDVDADADADDDVKLQEIDNKVKMEENKRKYDEEEQKLKALEAPPVERVQDDWQVAYVWAFITKFNQKEKIRGLESIEDFEKSLLEPVAIRPDDVLEGILIQFLKNLRPALRTLSAETIQNSLSNYINDQLLNSSEFTVWDRAWAANEEARGGCCNTAEDRTELGRLRYFGEPLSERTGKNPIKRQVEKGGGIFEMDWRERVKMLRQLVDWQLGHSEVIRAVINREFKITGAAAKKEAKGISELVPQDQFVKLDPLGHDRDKNRIWSIDNSTRVYKSGNPYKRPCPLVVLSQTRAEFDALAEKYSDHSEKPAVKPEGKGPKGKLTAAQSSQYKKAIKGKEDEGKVAEKLKEMIPAIEKEDARIQRAKKRVEAAANLASMAEWRSTRTRRTTRKIDYSYGAEDDEPEEEVATSSKRRRGDPEFADGMDDRGRAIIPGERRSARQSARDEYVAEEQEDEGDDDNYSDQEIEVIEPPNGNGDSNGHDNVLVANRGGSSPLGSMASVMEIE